MPEMRVNGHRARHGDDSSPALQSFQNPTESAFTAPLDLLADSESASQWPTLPLSPQRGPGASSSLLDAQPAANGARPITTLLDTLPRSSHRLPSESGFDLLAGSSDALLHSVGASLPDPANLHKAADAQPHREGARQRPRPESITLPPPPPRSKPRDPAGSLPDTPPPATAPPMAPPSPHSSWLSTSDSDTDYSHNGLEPATPSPNPPTQPPPRGAAIPKPPDLTASGRLAPRCSVPRLAIPKLSSQLARPHTQQLNSAPAAPSGPRSAGSCASDVPVGFGYESLHSPSTARSSSSSGDSPSATMGSCSAAPAWMSTSPPAGTPPLEPGILTPRTTSDGTIPCVAPQERLQPIPSATPSEYATAMSSTLLPPSRPLSSDSDTPMSSRRPLLPPPPAEGRAAPLSGVPARDRSGSPPPGQWVDSLGDHPSVNRAWSNPFFAVRSEEASRSAPGAPLQPATQPGPRQRATYPGAILSSHPDSENFQLPSNEQSAFDTSSQVAESSDVLSRGPSVPAAAIMSILGELHDVEQRISSEWAAEQALRADELASLPSETEDPAPLRGPRSRVTPDDVVAAARDGMRTARAHRVVPRELPEPPPETSRTLPESPRNWEERAAELEERLVEQQLESARAQADIEAKLLATERQLALSARAAAASPQLSHRDMVAGGAAPEDVGGAYEALQSTAAAVGKVEAMVHERLEPLVMHVGGMKRRMLSAQEEATALRAELATAQQRCTKLQADLQAQAKARDAGDAGRGAASEAAALPPLPPAPPSAQPDELNAVLRQLQLAHAENAQLRASGEAATERERGLHAIVAGRGAGDQLVPHAVHAEVLQQNRVLAAQVQQLRHDLEVLYMEDPWRTGTDTVMEGAGVGGSGAMPSAMNTVARLGALIGVGDSRTILRSMASNQRPSRSLGSSHTDLPESTSLHYGSFAAYPSESAIKSQRDLMAPITPEAAAKRQSSGSTPSASLLGAAPLIEASADLGVDSHLSHMHAEQSYLSPSQSMLTALERGTVMHIREQTAERLVSTLQNQAASIVEKDTHILRLEERVLELEAAAAAAAAAEAEAPSGATDVSGSVTVPLAAAAASSALAGDGSTVAPSSGRGGQLARAISADRAAMPDWESLPVPNTFKEALEQILMLQVENSRLKDKLGGYPTHTDDGLDPRDACGAAASVATSAGIPKPPGAYEKGRPPTGKSRSQQSRQRTLSNARKTLASMQMLADAMSSVQGQHLRPPESGDVAGLADGHGDLAVSGPVAVASSAIIANGNVMNGPELEVEVFKDLVMRELSDQVVAWQLAHGDVSKDLVGANMRLAELQTEHDQLIGLVKSLSCKPAHDREGSSPQKAHAVQTPSKTSRLGFFGRLKPPRRQ